MLVKKCKIVILVGGLPKVIVSERQFYITCQMSSSATWLIEFKLTCVTNMKEFKSCTVLYSD